MDLFLLWCQDNRGLALFVYGLVFIIMANNIQLQPKKGSKFEIANILLLLALFALFHGIHEFVEMWSEIKKVNFLILQRINWFILVVSYFFFFEFGRRFFRLTKVNPASLRGQIAKGLDLLLPVSIWLIIFFTVFLYDDFSITGLIAASYLFCFPAGLLIGFGFLFYYGDLKETFAQLKVKKYFLLAGVSFFFLGLLEGLVVPSGDFFPANWLNEESFSSLLHLPVEVFHVIFAILGTIGVLGMLKIFNWEKTKEIQDTLTVREKIAEGIDEAIILIDNDFRVVWANKKAVAIYGKLVGNCYYYDYAAHYSLKKREGSPEILDACPIVEVLTTDNANTMFHTYVDEKGGKNYVEVSAYPIRDKDNNIIEFVHVARDVTERVEAEESLKKAYSEIKKAQQDLIQSEKLASLGRFSMGVAHEVKNPLAIILSGVEFLELKCQNTDPDLIKATAAIKDAVFRADGIVRRLLKFSKPEQPKIEKIKPEDLLNEALSLFKYTTPLANIEIKTDFSAEQMYIEVDKNQIQQVIFNLIMNSIEAMPDGGVLKVKTSKDASTGFSGGNCIIEVSDTGEGISDENLARVFEPFFTTKRDMKGTGLGLSVSRTIVNNHRGEMFVTSKQHKGTVIKIVLPLA